MQKSKMFLASLRRPLLPALLMLVAMCILAACQPQAHPARGSFPLGSGGVNTVYQQDKPYLILVSIDAFRWDYMDRYPTPNLDRVASAGSRADRLLPVFPTLTFPNHYSIATGLYPVNHGIVANTFPDPVSGRWYSMKDRSAVEDAEFYGGEPIWVTAETQGMVAASFFFVGSEAPIKGVHPSHWMKFDGSVPGNERVDQVLAWLALPEETRPHLYTLYFEEVDSNSHWYGPQSAENIGAIERVDAYLGRLLDGLEALPHGDQVNMLIVSDHGQQEYLADTPPFVLSEHLDTGDASLIGGGSYLFIHLEGEEVHKAGEYATTVNHHWTHGTAYTRENAPVDWHVTDNPRFPDLILVPEPGHAITAAAAEGKLLIGDHGWAPEAPGMHGFFIASGPNIKPGLSLGPASTIDVYPLMTSILGLEGPSNIDGDASALAEVLKTRPN